MSCVCDSANAFCKASAEGILNRVLLLGNIRQQPSQAELSRVEYRDESAYGHLTAGRVGERRRLDGGGWLEMGWFVAIPRRCHRLSEQRNAAAALRLMVLM